MKEKKVFHLSFSKKTNRNPLASPLRGLSARRLRAAGACDGQGQALATLVSAGALPEAWPEPLGRRAFLEERFFKTVGYVDV